MTKTQAAPHTYAGTAVVIGGSVAGLCMARILSDRFERVQIIERDRLGTEAQPRAGVPQSHQVHILLMRGQQLFEELFPGLLDELVENGAAQFDMLGDSRLCFFGEWLQRLPSEYIMVGSSRVLLESTLRSYVMRIENVEFLDGLETIGLVGAEANQRVRGLRSRRRGPSPLQNEESVEAIGDNATKETIEEIDADFIVDASGRSSRAAQWLSELGYDEPEETVINSFLGYASRRYQPNPNFQPDWRMMLVGAYAPDVPWGGLIYPEENGTWMVMLNGAMKQYPPTDDEGFDEFVRQVNPEFSAAVQQATPLGKARGYRRTENRWRHYEKLDRWPDRFVVVGDALCAFNPVYGQGMTVAAITAEALGEHLDRVGNQRANQAANQAANRAGDPLDGAAPAFQQRAGQLVAPVWRLATGSDYSWPTTEGGERSALVKVIHWYNGKLSGALAHDRVLYATFTDVLQMMKPSTALLTPNVMLRVLRHYLFRRPSQSS